MYKFDGCFRFVTLLQWSGPELAAICDVVDMSKRVRVGIELVEMSRLVGLVWGREVREVRSKVTSLFSVDVMALSAISFIDFCNNYQIQTSFGDLHRRGQNPRV